MKPKIDMPKYMAQIKASFGDHLTDELIEKDLRLTSILSKIAKNSAFKNLIFKGSSLLSRNYLKYHRFAEDLDFTYSDCNSLKKLPRNQREKKIKAYIEKIMPAIIDIAISEDLDFSYDRSDTKYFTILGGRAVYMFKMYYEEHKFIKIQITFVDELLSKPINKDILTIADYCMSKKVMLGVGSSTIKFKLPCFNLQEILLEKYRSILTRPTFKERDLFDLYLIEDSLEVDTKQVIQKLKAAYPIKKDIIEIIAIAEKKLEREKFFEGDEKAIHLAISKFDNTEFMLFKKKITPILIDICNKFIEETLGKKT